MNEKIEESETTKNQTEAETTKSIEGHFAIGDEFDMGDELHDFDYGDEQPLQKKVGENVIRKPNIIRDNEDEIRAAAQAAFEKYGPVTVVIVNDKSHSVVVEKKEPSSVTKHELKPCVKAFFGIAVFVLIAALVISWMY
ncbi:hypothetical protein [Pseudomonas sp. MF6747]|uniref:hypothetical protein n=1 Tax=Pseudomonas sp. MF6747 TaxID=2797527 RepID=UPI00190E320A|nr:hypothetical protein [Pseudomonas sp. MF6747]MBK3506757.1 hypothetical protein [Pseudomonas sp. MF6747]